MVSAKEKTEIRVKGLQRRLELTAIKQLHRYERTGDMGDNFDEEATKYLTILNGLRKQGETPSTPVLGGL